ncbi:MAG: single-stranded-DNA-specific exonuclease RecJ, partial [Saezia sp.]
MQIITRPSHPRKQWQLEQAGIHPLLAQLYAARGVSSEREVSPDFQYLLPPDSLKGIDEATELLMNAFEGQKKICFVADYDCDGATACCVGLRGLAMLGFKPTQLSYIVPDRMSDGYGLTASIAERVKATGADILVTVDNGIASLAGVAHARQLGLQVLITDHHLPAIAGDKVMLPEADAIVNPNQPGCHFASKALAGVGVVFYILIALRTRMREQGLFEQNNQPRIDRLLDLVALGTVADVVRLDENNRRLVEQGLMRMRKGQMQPGVAALFEVALRSPNTANTFDLGFSLGPRLNAAGRLADMGLGIECLLTDSVDEAKRLAA